MGNVVIFRAFYIRLLQSIGEPYYIMVPHTGNYQNDCKTARKLLGLEEDVNMEDFKSWSKTKKVTIKL